MIWVSIGGQRAELQTIDPRWIHSEVRKQEAFGPVCVRIEVQQGSVSLNFATQGCGSFSGGHRRYTREEHRLIEFWMRFGLGEPHWTSGNLIAFLQQLRNL